MTVVDLDGTLLCGNSFRWFTRYVLRLAVRRRPMAAAELCVLLALRRLRACSHRRLKWHLMKIADIVLSADDYSAFARMLKERINRRVLAALGNEQKIVIASAASDEYVAPFVELMGWRYHVATRRPPSGKYSDYIECRGEMKVKAFCLHGQFGHVCFVTSGMAADEIWYNLLVESFFAVDAVKDVLEGIELTERRFAHQSQHIVVGMFRSHLQSSAYMTAYQFTGIFGGGPVHGLILAAVQQQIVANAAPYETLFYARHGVDGMVYVKQSAMVSV